jgi:selenocysteine lyase/cysteine desulfurase
MTDALDAPTMMSLLAGGPVDAATVARLRAVDPAAVRAALSPYLRDVEVDALLERLRALIDEGDPARE